MAYASPGAMGLSRLARNTPGASEALEGTPYNGPYGKSPLKKRAVFNLEANESVGISRVKYR